MARNFRVYLGTQLGAEVAQTLSIFGFADRPRGAGARIGAARALALVAAAGLVWVPQPAPAAPIGWQQQFKVVVSRRAVRATQPVYGYPYEAVVVEAVDAVAFSFSASSPFGRSLHYQSKVYALAPPVAAPDNTGTLSTWHQPLSIAVQHGWPSKAQGPLSAPTEIEVVVEFTTAFSHHSQIINRRRTTGY